MLKKEKKVLLNPRSNQSTVFLSGAQVFESAVGNFPSGEVGHSDQGTNLPTSMKKVFRSKVKAIFIIQAVNRRLDYLSAKK